MRNKSLVTAMLLATCFLIQTAASAMDGDADDRRSPSPPHRESITTARNADRSTQSAPPSTTMRHGSHIIRMWRDTSLASLNWSSRLPILNWLSGSLILNGSRLSLLRSFIPRLPWYPTGAFGQEQTINAQTPVPPRPEESAEQRLRRELGDIGIRLSTQRESLGQQERELDEADASWKGWVPFLNNRKANEMEETRQAVRESEEQELDLQGQLQQETSRLERERLAAEAVEREHKEKEARLVTLGAEEARLREALQIGVQTAYAQLIESAAEGRQRALEAEQQAFLAHSVGWLGGVPDDRLPPSIRAQKLTSSIVNRDSYYVLNAPSDDYKWVRTQIVRDNKDHQMLFDLAVVHRAGNFKDGHADNTFIIKAREMGADALPAAVKLVRRCADTLKAGAPQDGLSASISDMMTDTIVTGGRIGLNLRRQATEAEMAVIIPALRQRGERAFAQAANNVENALNELARIFLDAAFRREKGATSARVVDYDKSLFDSHKAHCFIAATRGLQDGEVENLIESTYGEKLGMAKAQILATRKYYDRFDQ